MTKRQEVKFKLQIEKADHTLVIEDPLLTDLDIFKDNLKVLRYLLENPTDENDRCTAAKISEATGLSTAPIYKHFHTLKARGILTKVRNGVYRLSDDLMPRDQFLKIGQQEEIECPETPIGKDSSKVVFKLQIEQGGQALVVEDPTLTDLDIFKNNLKVLQYMLENSVGEYVYASTEEIGEAIGFSQVFIYKYLRTLRDKGVVAKFGNGVYVLTQALVSPGQDQRIEDQSRKEWIKREKKKFEDPKHMEIEVHLKWEGHSIKLSDQLLSDLDIFNGDLRILEFLLSNCSSDGHVFGSRSQMSKIIGRSPLSIRYYLYNLMDKGLITKEGRDTYVLTGALIPTRELVDPGNDGPMIIEEEKDDEIVIEEEIKEEVGEETNTEVAIPDTSVSKVVTACLWFLMPLVAAVGIVKLVKNLRR